MNIGLGKQAVPAVINRCQCHGLRVVMMQKSPVSIMPIKISEERIHYKHIPEVFQQLRGVDILLFSNGIQDVFQLCPRAVMLRINDRVFDRAEVEQFTSIHSKILADTDDVGFSAHIEGSKDRLLSRHADHVSLV